MHARGDGAPVFVTQKEHAWLDLESGVAKCARARVTGGKTHVHTRGRVISCPWRVGAARAQRAREKKTPPACP